MHRKVFIRIAHRSVSISLIQPICKDPLIMFAKSAPHEWIPWQSLIISELSCNVFNEIFASCTVWTFLHPPSSGLMLLLVITVMWIIHQNGLFNKLNLSFGLCSVCKQNQIICKFNHWIILCLSSTDCCLVS